MNLESLTAMMNKDSQNLEIKNEKAKAYMIELFINNLNFNDIYDTLDKKFKKAIYNTDIDHFLVASESHLVGISLRYELLFTFTKVGDTVVKCCDEQGYLHLAYYYYYKQI